MISGSAKYRYLQIGVMANEAEVPVVKSPYPVELPRVPSLLIVLTLACAEVFMPYSLPPQTARIEALRLPGIKKGEPEMAVRAPVCGLKEEPMTVDELTATYKKLELATAIPLGLAPGHVGPAIEVTAPVGLIAYPEIAPASVLTYKNEGVPT